MIKAAVRNGVDFSQAQLLGRWWWIKVGWLLAEIQREDEGKLLLLQHAQHTAALNYMSGDKAFKFHWEEATKHIRLYHNKLFPWASEDVEDAETQRYVKLSERWKQVYGDQNDPMVQQKIHETVDSWYQVVAEAEMKAYGEVRSKHPSQLG